MCSNQNLSKHLLNHQHQHLQKNLLNVSHQYKTRGIVICSLFLWTKISVRLSAPLTSSCGRLFGGLQPLYEALASFQGCRPLHKIPYIPLSLQSGKVMDPCMQKCNVHACKLMCRGHIVCVQTCPSCPLIP